MRPFIKWAGGKQFILPHILKLLSCDYENYYEPFLGGGAVFFKLKPENAFLSDINSNLITTYTAIRDNVNSVIQELLCHTAGNNQQYFFDKRAEFFVEKDPVKIAGLFIYLNKTCFNGLYRVNKSGKFNTSFGHYKNPTILDEQNLLSVSSILKNVDLQVKSFTEIPVQSKALYYLDPPYHCKYNSYNENVFTEEHHKELAAFCKNIHEQGGYFILSNSNTEFVKALYKDFAILDVAAKTCIGYKQLKREELLITNVERLTHGNT